LPGAVAQRGSSRSNLGPKVLDDLSRAVGLDKIDDGAKENQNSDQCRVEGLADETRDDCDQQDNRQRVCKQVQKVQPRRPRVLFNQFIWTELCDPRSDLLRAQTWERIVGCRHRGTLRRVAQRGDFLDRLH
jgi:hypothetical protein